MASSGHTCVVKQTEKLHEIMLRRLKAPHVVRKGVYHLEDSALIRGVLYAANRLRKAT